MKVSSQFHVLATFYFAERTLGTHWIRGLMGLRAEVHMMAKRKSVALPGIGSPSHPTWRSHFNDWLTFNVSNYII